MSYDEISTSNRKFMRQKQHPLQLVLLRSPNKSWISVNFNDIGIAYSNYSGCHEFTTDTNNTSLVRTGPCKFKQGRHTISHLCFQFVCPYYALF